MPSYARSGIFGKMFEVTASSERKSFAVARDETISTAAFRAGVSHICRRGARGTGPATVAIEVGHAAELPREIPARVVSIERPTSEVAVVTLRVPLGEPFDYFPGQYIGIAGPDGFVRALSIANAPRTDRTMELHVGRLQGCPVTNHIHRHLNVGDVIRIETPQGSHHFPSDESRPLIAIVGGTGYAPLQAMLEDWVAREVRKEVHLYWGNRLPSRFYAMRTAERLVSLLPKSTFAPVVSSGNLDDGWHGRRGLVHLAALADFADLKNVEVFVCGPPGLVDAAERDCLASGLSADRFYADVVEEGKIGHPRVGEEAETARSF
jgi:CDP-4-dehydro-6-deoxyglucose reductase, E3